MLNLTDLLPPLSETAAQTAPRLRRRLNARWRGHPFTVRSDALSQTVTVTWTGGPSPAQVHELTRFHCRQCDPEPTLWSDPSGTISLVRPLATVVLRHNGSHAAAQAPCAPF